MEHLLRKFHLHPTTFGVLYVAYFIYSVHLFLVAFVNSTFLRTVVDEALVGALYVIGSALAITTLLGLSRLLRYIGNYRGLVFFTTAEILALLGLAVTTTPVFVVLLFVTHFALFPLILYNLDIFVESSTTDEGATGNVRGLLLTIMSVALIFSPFLAGLLVGEDGRFGRVYLLSATLLVPFLGVIALRFRHFLDPRYQNGKVIEHLRYLAANPVIWRSLSAHFILRIFFAVMVVYLPIYLFTVVGFTWPEIGIILAIMLSPHALFGVPLGHIADKSRQSAALLVGGFVAMAAALTAIAFLDSGNILFWMAILFALRAGAAAVEVMTETYFFKCVDGDDSETIGIFRVLRPFSYLIGLTGATIFLAFFDLRLLFLALAVVMIVGAHIGTLVART